MFKLTHWLFDLKVALRGLAKRPFFVALTVFTLALGIAATATIFSITNAVFVRPLPYPEAEELVRVLAVNPALGITGAGLALGDYRDFQSQSTAMSGFAIYSTQSLDLSGDGSPEVVRGARVSSELLPVLQVEPQLGEGFSESAQTPGLDRVALLSHDFWQRRFGGAPDVVSRTFELDGNLYEVIGVMPEGFSFPRQGIDLWVPFSFPAAPLDRWSHYLGAIGRLRDGVDVAQAEADLQQVAARLEADFPDSNRDWSARVVSYAELLTGSVRPALTVLSGAVFLLLLIACANVANLLLIRGASRQKEAAIRATLGSSRAQLVRLFIIESTVLALAATAIALFLTKWGLQALIAFGPQDFPRLAEIRIDHLVFGFALILALLSGLALGLFPALQVTRLDINRLIKSEHGTGGKASSVVRAGLVVLEVAFALVLLASSALMLRGFASLSRVDPGFDSDNVLVSQVFLSPNRYASVPPQVEFFEGLLERARATPGVEAVAATSAVPMLSLGQNLLQFEAEESTAPEAESGKFASFSAVTPGYFKTLGISQLDGRDFETFDNAGAPPVAIVNSELAERYWPGESAVGKRLKVAIFGTEPVSHEVVGVTQAVHMQSLDEEPAMAFYAPYLQAPHRGMALVARTSGNPLDLAEPIRHQVEELDADQPVYRTVTLAALLSEAGARTRFYAGLITLFGTIGLILAAVGVYGVIAYAISLRSNEIAIRLALGARAADIFRLVVGGGIKLALLGSGLGLLGALALSRVLSSLLYGVSPRDPLSLASATVFLLLISTLACYAAARSSVHLDPSQSIRQHGTGG